MASAWEFHVGETSMRRGKATWIVVRSHPFCGILSFDFWSTYGRQMDVAWVSRGSRFRTDPRQRCRWSRIGGCRRFYVRDVEPAKRPLSKRLVEALQETTSRQRGNRNQGNETLPWFSSQYAILNVGLSSALVFRWS